MPANKAAPASLTKRAVIGTGWSVAATGGRQVLALVFVGVLGRILGPEAYGLVGMAGIVTNFLVNFRDLGTGAAIVQRQEISGELLSTVFWMNISLGVLLTGAILACSWPVAVFFGEPRVAPLLQALSVSFLIAACGIVPESLLRRESLFQHLAVAELSSAICGYAVAITCALQGMGVWSLVTGNLTGAVVTTTLNFRFARWRPALTMNWAVLRSIAGFSLNLSGFTLVNYLARNADSIIVGRTLGSRPLGLYQMAYNLMMFPLQNISAVIAQAQFPGFARIQNDLVRFRDAWLRSCRLVSLVTFPVVAGLAVVADPLVRTVLGPKWIPVIGVFQILAPVGLLQSVQTLCGMIYIGTGRTKLLLAVGVLNTTAVITAYLIGIRWGVTGVATSYLIACMALAPFTFAIAFRVIGLEGSRFVASLTPQLGITALMAATAAAVKTALGGFAPAVQLAGAVAAGTLAYAAMLRLLKPAVLHDLGAAVGQVNARLGRAVRSAFGIADAPATGR